MASRIVRTPDGPKIQADPRDWYAAVVVALDKDDWRLAETCARALLHVATPSTPASWLANAVSVIARVERHGHA